MLGGCKVKDKYGSTKKCLRTCKNKKSDKGQCCMLGATDCGVVCNCDLGLLWDEKERKCVEEDKCCKYSTMSQFNS